MSSVGCSVIVSASLLFLSLRCEGFAECSLRYLRGEPSEIVVKKRDA